MAASPGGQHLAEAQLFLAPRGRARDQAAELRGRRWREAPAWSEAQPAYRRVAVSAGMLLRNVKVITTNMKTRRRGLL